MNQREAERMAQLKKLIREGIEAADILYTGRNFGSLTQRKIRFLSMSMSMSMSVKSEISSRAEYIRELIAGKKSPKTPVKLLILNSQFPITRQARCIPQKKC